MGASTRSRGRRRAGDGSGTEVTAPARGAPRAARVGARGRIVARRAPASLSEAEWQAIVIDLAESVGWRYYHPYDSRRSVSGWPDLTLIRDGRIVFAELKKESGRPSVEQREWLEELDACLGVQAFLWRPSDIAEVERALGIGVATG